MQVSDSYEGEDTVTCESDASADASDAATDASLLHLRYHYTCVRILLYMSPH